MAGVPDKSGLECENRIGSTFKATWQAICNLPVNQFPLLLQQAHPVASPFILWRLKGLGYSNCRVVSMGDGLMVFADR